MADETARTGVLQDGASVLEAISEQVNQLAVQQWMSRQAGTVPSDVLQFLETHAFLLPLLDEAQNAIAHYFGNTANVYEMFSDPEDGITTKLVLSISPQSAPSDAVRQYWELVKGWWVPVLPRARGALTIVVEYR